MTTRSAIFMWRPVITGSAHERKLDNSKKERESRISNRCAHAFISAGARSTVQYNTLPDIWRSSDVCGPEFGTAVLRQPKQRECRCPGCDRLPNTGDGR